jgi:hypothetical protein
MVVVFPLPPLDFVQVFSNLKSRHLFFLPQESNGADKIDPLKPRNFYGWIFLHVLISFQIRFLRHQLEAPFPHRPEKPHVEPQPEDGHPGIHNSFHSITPPFILTWGLRLPTRHS